MFFSCFAFFFVFLPSLNVVVWKTKKQNQGYVVFSKMWHPMSQQIMLMEKTFMMDMMIIIWRMIFGMSLRYRF